MTSLAWADAKIRWPQREVLVKEIYDVGTWYDFGHIPPILFTRKLSEEYAIEARPQDVRHEYWRLQYDLFGEYAYTVTLVQKGAPFAIPVTAWGPEI